MLTYLFDASAAVEIYLPRDARTEKVVQHIVAQKTTYHEATLYIPNFCIAEVFNTFARKRFKPRAGEKELTEGEYEGRLRGFRNHIHWGRTLYPYDLNRYHIIGADIIVPVEHQRDRKSETDHLSTFDILIISMACELAWIGNRNKVYLVTCDKRLKLISDDLRETSVGKLLVKGPLGELDEARWIPPKCIYLPDVPKTELERVTLQPRPNI